MRVVFCISARASYARSALVMKALADLFVEDIIVYLHGSAIVPRYGDLRGKTGVFERHFHTLVDGGEPDCMVRTTGMAAMDIGAALAMDRPDVVVTVADRHETIAHAIAASYQNIPLVHLQGGEVTGSIDDRVRNAISMLSTVHCCSTEVSAERLKTMMVPGDIYWTGCPSIDLAALVPDSLPRLPEMSGVGPWVDPADPERYAVFLQHPDTHDYGDGVDYAWETLEALRAMEVPFIGIWPNADAGTEEISKSIREFREINPHYPAHWYRNLPPDVFIQLIRHCACLVGNSSVAIREGSFLGVPAVNIGLRQMRRETGQNVVKSLPLREEIEQAIKLQWGKHYAPANLYGDGHAAVRIATAITGGDPLSPLFPVGPEAGSQASTPTRH